MVETAAIVRLGRRPPTRCTFLGVSSDGVAHDHEGTFANDVLAVRVQRHDRGQAVHRGAVVHVQGAEGAGLEGQPTFDGQAVLEGKGIYKK